MKLACKFKQISHILAGLVLLGAACHSSAMTLGRVRGAVLVGQPLNVTVQLQADPGDTAASLAACVSANVTMGDVTKGSDAVRVVTAPGAQPDQINLRVTTTSVVDEPVVSVEVRVGCGGQKTSRRYVLLADVPSEPASDGPQGAAASAAVVRPMAPAPGVALPALATPPAPAAKAPAVRKARTPKRAAAVSAATPAVAQPAAVVVKPAGKNGAGKTAPIGSIGNGARLKLDPAELLIERDPTLSATPELASAATDNAQVRAQAAALWHAINMSPDEVLRDSQRLKGLDADVRSLRTLVEKNQKAMAELQMQLAKAEHDRFDGMVVYALAALLAAALGAAFYFWRRKSEPVEEEPQWWKGSTLGAAGGSRSPMETGPGNLSAHGGFVPSGTTPLRPTSATAPLEGFDLDLDVDESMFDSLRNAKMPMEEVLAQVEKLRLSSQPAALRAASATPAASAAPAAPAKPAFAVQNLAGRDFGASAPGGLRGAAGEELFDIRQQADFFVSLGQYDRAIQTLESCMDENGDASPLVYLDLLKVLHTLGRKSEFERHAERFNRLFTGRIHDFASFPDEGQGLEAYPELFARITKLWLSVEVVDLIEVFIFRNPGGDFSQAYDLAAYRDLLLLHAIAKRLLGAEAGFVDSGNGALTRNPFKSSSMQFTALDMDTNPGALEPVVSDAADAVDLELDLDLSGDAFDSEISTLVPVDALPTLPSPDEPGQVVKLAEATQAVPRVVGGDDNLIDFDFDLPVPKSPPDNKA